MAADPLRNPKDPLHATPPSARELLRRIGEVCDGFNGDQIIDGNINMIINILRQSHANWDSAEKSFDTYFGKAKQILKNQYSGNAGRKKGIFPYDQVINVPFLDFGRKR